MDLHEQLQIAATALAEEPRALGRALDALLAAWRICRSPDVAELIDEISKRLPRGLERWPTPKDLREADPVALWTMLWQLGPHHDRYGTVAAELEALASRPPDPRVSRRLLELADTADLERSFDDWFPELRGEEAKLGAAKLIAQIGDPRARDQLPAHEAVRALLGPYAASISHAAPLDDAAQALCLRAHDLLRPRHAETLEIAARAHPDDLDTCLVFADALLDSPSPAERARGELIALQCRPGERDRAHEDELVRAHGEAWLGELAPALDRPRFERGFLVACAIGRMDLALVGHPLFATVTELDVFVHHVHASRMEAFLRHPVLRRLRRVSGLYASDLHALLCDASALPALTHATCVDAAPVKTLFDALAGAGLPALISLDLGKPEQLRLSHPFGADAVRRVLKLRPLHELAVEIRAAELGPIRDAAEGSPGTEELRVTNPGWSMRWRRWHDRLASVELEISEAREQSIRDLASGLSTLGSDAIAEIRLPKRLPVMVRNALARFGARVL